MKFTLRLLAGFASLGLLLTGPTSHAQQPTAPAASDVLLLSNGQELSGQVLTISPTELTYRPAPVAGATLLSDTVRLPVASVFMVRYANGTREVLAQLHPAAPASQPDPTPLPLRNLAEMQRQALGRRDALVYYQHSGPFWGSFGASIYLGPLLGLASTAGIANSPVKPINLNAPQPALLADPGYRLGYQQQANQLKRRRTWGGYCLATGLYVLLVGVAVSQ